MRKINQPGMMKTAARRAALSPAAIKKLFFHHRDVQYYAGTSQI